jgi:type VI secretion system secreted protein Hcp
MALPGYLTLEGKNQGKIEGDCVQKGREKTILVYKVEHIVEIPRDNLTGLPTGNRIHRPLTVTKHTDPASPLLYQACATGEQMKSWKLDYYHINDKGQEELYYEVQLTNAVIVNIHHYKPMVMDETLKPYYDMEDVSFTYEAITWSHKVANKEAQDNWKEPASG